LKLKQKLRLKLKQKKAAPKKAAAKKATKDKDEKSTKSKAKEKGDKEPIKDLKDLGEAVAEKETKTEEPEVEQVVKVEENTETQAEPRVQKLDEFGRAYATGRRKSAVARVWIKPGKGIVVVNGKDQTVYFGRQTQRLILNQPFLVSDRVGHFDVMCTVVGGGLSGQAGAVRHGISRALENFDPGLRPVLKKAGMLTRDSRIVERKKIGKHKARRSKQWAKR